MTDEEKAKMEKILLRHWEEDDRLCPIAEAVPGDYVTVVLRFRILGLFNWRLAAPAIMLERDLSRPDDGAKIKLLLKNQADVLHLPLDHPCLVTPGVED